MTPTPAPLSLAEADPKGLVREAYRIDGIGLAECKSILIDWALSLPTGVDSAPALARVLAEFAGGAPDHPMTQVLREGQETAPTPRRRGGYAGRRGD